MDIYTVKCTYAVCIMIKQKKFLFDWDKGNRTKNLIKHSISIEEQEEAFYDVRSKRFDDPKHSVNERRFLLFGETKQGKRLVVAFTIREGRIRPISARPMNRKEAIIYEEAIKFA